MTAFRLALAPMNRGGSGRWRTQVEGPLVMDMECILCPWILWGGCPRTHGLGMDIDFVQLISIGYPFEVGDPHVSGTHGIINPNHTFAKFKDHKTLNCGM